MKLSVRKYGPLLLKLACFLILLFFVYSKTVVIAICVILFAFKLSKTKTAGSNYDASALTHSQFIDAKDAISNKILNLDIVPAVARNI